MKLDIDGIQAFALIARLGSFQKAADTLRLTQPALTRRIQRLEGYLGLALLDRTTRTVSVTRIGREFLPQAERLVQELTRSVDRLKGMSRASTGDVSIACLAYLAHHWLPSVIQAYAREHASNRVAVLDRTAAQVTAAVKQGHAELGINLMTRRDDDISEMPILEDPFVLFCQRDDPISGTARASWADLRGLDLITLSGTSESRMLINYHLARKRLDVQTRFEVEHLSTALGLVRAGLGIAILPSSTLFAEIQTGISQVRLVNPVVKRGIGLIKRKGASLSPAARALYSLIAKRLAADAAHSSWSKP